MYLRRTPKWALLWLAVAVQTATACQRLNEWKASWHGTASRGGFGALSVEVTPRQGISIWLDGERVSTSSPYATQALAAGSHVLEVRGMGHYTVALPVRIDAKTPLYLPVRLRQRPVLAFVAKEAAATVEPPPATPAQSPAPEAVPVAPPRAVGRPPRAGDGPPLRLAVEARPASAIVVDGVPADADDVRLLREQGLIAIGDMRLAYRVRPGRQLELTIPHEAERTTTWTVQGLQVKAKSLVRLSAPAVVVRRAAREGRLEASLRRVD